MYGSVCDTASANVSKSVTETKFNFHVLDTASASVRKLSVACSGEFFTKDFLEVHWQILFILLVPVSGNTQSKFLVSFG